MLVAGSLVAFDSLQYSLIGQFRVEIHVEVQIRGDRVVEDLCNAHSSLRRPLAGPWKIVRAVNRRVEDRMATYHDQIGGESPYGPILDTNPNDTKSHVQQSHEASLIVIIQESVCLIHGAI
jgi:hypothetical protein